MRATTQWILGLVLAITGTGCGKQASAPTTVSSSATALVQPALTAWQQGDKAAATARFTETDWSRVPLFPSNSPLRLTEEEFIKLSVAERQSKSPEMMSQLDELKRLAGAVAQAGREAAAKGNATQARKYFVALRQCGTALDSSDRMRLVQLVGQGMKKAAEAELGKLGQ